MGRFLNRIIGSGMESLDSIMFNPRNWRVHPLYQQDALKGVLEEVGWVQQVIVNKVTGNLVDGHLRCQLAAREGEDEVPVVYVELTEDEEKLILATLDPVGSLAGTDNEKLNELISEIETENAGVQDLLDDLEKKSKPEDNENYLVYEQAIQLMPQKEYVVIMCDEDGEFEEIRKRLNLKEVRRGGYKHGSVFDAVGVQRVIHAKDFFELMDGVKVANSDTE